MPVGAAVDSAVRDGAVADDAGWAVLLLLIGCWQLAAAHRRGGGLAKALGMLPRDRFDFVWIFDAEPGVPNWLRPVFAGPKGRLYAVAP